MAAHWQPGVPPFEVGESLFIIERDQVRVLGRQGSEAVIPLADFEAFLEHLAGRYLPEPAGTGQD